MGFLRGLLSLVAHLNRPVFFNSEFPFYSHYIIFPSRRFFWNISLRGELSRIVSLPTSLFHNLFQFQVLHIFLVSAPEIPSKTHGLLSLLFTSDYNTKPSPPRFWYLSIPLPVSIHPSYKPHIHPCTCIRIKPTASFWAQNNPSCIPFPALPTSILLLHTKPQASSSHATKPQLHLLLSCTYETPLLLL